MRKSLYALSFSLLALTAQAEPVEKFGLSDIRLLDSPFKQAQDKNLEYILAMDPDRLLAPYLREAGLPGKADSYGNWENSGLDGHIGGHYLSALSLAYAATGNQEAKARLDYMLNAMQRAQDKIGTGYIAGIPGGVALWQEVAEGHIDVGRFNLNNKWVPLYNLHKVFAGLRDAYLYADSQQALTLLIKLGDWGAKLLAKLSDEQVQQLLYSEHGGLNEIYADLSVITGNPEYLQIARRLSDREILDPLLHKQDALTGLHANTQIPKVIGYKRVGDLADDKHWQEAAEFFWRQVVEHRSIAIGGNSVREHFHPSDDFTAMVEEIEGPETCNTYNMLKLTDLLYQQDPQTRYIRYYERALYNHILSSQHPDTGGLVYFTPARPQHYRVYSQVHDGMWCCVGSGIENHSKYGELIYAHRGDDLYVNLFIPSQLQWRDKGLTLVQENRIPDEDSSTLTFQGNAKATLHLRYPAWVAPGKLTVRINGKRVKHHAQPGSYLTLRRHWHDGDRITLEMPMHTELEQMPDGSDYFALVYGPVVLAAKTQPFANEHLDFFADDSRMGHVAWGAMCPLETAPTFVSEQRNFVDQIKRLPGDKLQLSVPAALHSEGKPVTELIPFFRLHESRYMLYWPVTTPAQFAEHQRLQAQADQARLALEKVTIDKVAPGEQQPESDHFFAGKDTDTGIHKGRHWRLARGWFSYQLKDPQQEAKTLRVTYYGYDSGRRFNILLNGTRLAEVELKGDRGDAFFNVDYSIPAELYGLDTLTVRFEAAPDSLTAGVYDVRLLRD